MNVNSELGIIAGNGCFPFLVLDAARRLRGCGRGDQRGNFSGDRIPRRNRAASGLFPVQNWHSGCARLDSLPLFRFGGFEMTLRLLQKSTGRAVLVVLLALSSASAMTPNEARSWQEDLRFMAKQMEEKHKNLYHSISANDFAAMIATLNDRIPSLTRSEVIVEMAKIAAAIGDGHTNIYPTRDAKIGFHRLPVIFTFFGPLLYVRAVQGTDRNLLGARVVRIGNLDADQAYAAAKKMIGCDNDGGARYWAQYLLSIPEVLEALHITSRVENVPLTLATAEGELKVTLHPSGPVEVMAGDTSTLFYPREGWLDARDLSTGPDPLWLRQIDAPFHFEHLGSLLYVQINRVGDSTDETLAHFAQRLYDEISATTPAKVAIDLRQNRGGDGTLIVPLIRCIIQSQSIDRPGHLFGIIGPATFSAAQMLTDALEKYTNITFVGEPTGSKGNTYGDSRKIILPNSGITVRISVYHWQDWYPWENRDATFPQIPAPLTFEAYSHKIDPALDAIIAAR